MIKIINILKKIFIIVLIILFISSFSASYNSLNIDNSAFVIAIGIDKSTTNKLKVTFEFLATSSSGNSASETQPILNTVECSSITNGINMMNAHLGRKVNISHCKLIVFSEELAKDGISNEVYSLINEVQIRPTANIVVSKCNTRYYIQNSVPSLENLIPKYYDIFPNTSKYTGYTCNATIGDVFNSLVCNYGSAYAILGGLSTSDDNSSTSQYLDDSSIKSNDTQINAKRKSQNIGLAVFKDDKLVGELNAIETICFNTIKRKLDSFLVSIPNPQNSTSKIDIYITPDNANNINISFINGAPYVKIKLDFSGKIYSMSKGSQYLNTDVLNSISNSCNSYLEKQFSNYLYKTSTVFESDINTFGLYALHKFSTTTDFDNYNWLNNYKNCTFDVEINTVMDSGFLLTQT